jgi:hypothetical protein
MKTRIKERTFILLKDGLEPWLEAWEWKLQVKAWLVEARSLVGTVG